LAVFPFALAFRFIEGIGNLLYISQSLAEGQTLLHEGLEVEKGVSKVLREVKIAGRISRTAKLSRSVRIISRFPRFVKAFTFYEVPWGKHHKTRSKAKVGSKTKSSREFNKVKPSSAVRTLSKQKTKKSKKAKK